VGLTPETLFHRCGNGVESLALAGTAPHSEDVSLSSNPKELSEHAFVRRDIAERLSPFGKVEVGPLSVQPFGHVFHLHSPICLTLNRPATFSDLVSALHPTAALGTYPRSPEGTAFLRFQEIHVPRGLHGAPFGVEWEEPGGTRAKALVAIRNLQWDGDRMLAVSGAGVVRESTADNEWRECRLKRAHLMAVV
jgi:isochorismate synthase EntC